MITLVILTHTPHVRRSLSPKRKEYIDMFSTCTDRLMIGVLFISAIPATAQTGRMQPRFASAERTVSEDDRSEASASGAWRCSLDGKYYSLTSSNGLRITAIRTGQIAADILQKINKKGRVTLEGQWHAGSYSGLMVVQKMEPNYVAAQMLVPATGAPFSACTSRKSAILFSLGQPQPICNAVSVSWNFQPAISAAEVASQEIAQDFLTANATPSQASNSSGGAGSLMDSSLTGIWTNESATAVSYEKTRLVLRADGTYTKTFGARPPTMGGGVVGAPTWGDTHSGTWSVTGPMRVMLSGDSQHTPYAQDLRLLTKH